MFEKGFFGSFFDLDKDGKLDPLEFAMDIAAFEKLIGDDEEDEENEDCDDEVWE